MYDCSDKRLFRFGGAFELMKEGDTSGIWGMINEQMKLVTLCLSLRA